MLLPPLSPGEVHSPEWSYVQPALTPAPMTTNFWRPTAGSFKYRDLNIRPAPRPRFRPAPAMWLRDLSCWSGSETDDERRHHLTPPIFVVIGLLQLIRRFLRENATAETPYQSTRRKNAANERSDSSRSMPELRDSFGGREGCEWPSRL